MKKVLYVLLVIGLLTGCSCTANMGNTPTKKVEDYLNKYQTNDNDVISDLEDVLTNDTSLTADERADYSDFMKKHYQDMQYEIKDETIDGDVATVLAEVTVRSYTDVLNNANQYRIDNPDEFTDTNTFATYRLDKLKEVTDTETYTITFHLTKEDEEWKIQNLTDEDLRKISGMYGVTDINALVPSESDSDEEDASDESTDIVEDNNVTDDNTNDTTSGSTDAS